MIRIGFISVLIVQVWQRHEKKGGLIYNERLRRIE